MKNTHGWIKLRLYLSNDDKSKLIKKAFNLSLIKNIEIIYHTGETFIIDDSGNKLFDIDDIVNVIMDKYNLTFNHEVLSLINSIKKFNYKIINPNERLGVCEQCKFSKKTIVGLRCQICGCFLAAKARMDSEECPLGKWRR